MRHESVGIYIIYRCHAYMPSLLKYQCFKGLVYTQVSVFTDTCLLNDLYWIQVKKMTLHAVSEAVTELEKLTRGVQQSSERYS